MKKTGTMLLMLIMLVSISSTSQNPIDKQHQELVRNQQNSEDIINLQDSNDNHGSIEDTLDENVDGYKTSYNDGEEEFPKCPPDDNNVVDMTLCGTITFGRDVV